MIRSMTGYGRGRAAEGEVAMRVEIRSVNNRGREVRLRLPNELVALEPELRGEVQERVARGRVDAFVEWEGPAPAGPRFAVNPAHAAAMLAAWRELAVRLELPGEPGVGDLLRLPGVVEPVPGTELDPSRFLPLARTALRAALDEHARSREREGAALARDLRERAELIVRLVAEIEERVPGAAARQAQDLRARVTELLGAVPLDEARLAQEVALLAQRADVTEEIVRLDAHLSRLAALFGPQGTEIGRALEFLVQEIRREVSTLSAKCGEPEIDARTLAIKAELERIKEQSANLE
ncbi:MAG: YicC family protein [Acidobacteria bacterium]|jgi:uncharacterized protein (TIGR00255 family)|nr:YicC family protein [Acidobacteriota bacterium]